jgi:hypothetical protein
MKDEKAEALADMVPIANNTQGKKETTADVIDEVMQ